jgi:23S rRNA U2552 (ribose-2'-O)-methylase RlmE/FtsJ
MRQLSAAQREVVEAVTPLPVGPLGVAERVLRPGGALVLKGFPGPESDAVLADLRQRYGKVSTVRPKATRTTSKEFYWVVGARGSSKASAKARTRRRRRR